MDHAAIESVRCSHSSGEGRFTVTVDVCAARVRPEEAALQPRDVTYAQDERLVIQGGGAEVALEVFQGEFARGAAGALASALCRLVREASS